MLNDDLDADNDPAWEAELLRREAEMRSGAVACLPAREAIESLPVIDREAKQA